MSGKYTIKELSELLDLPSSTLRYWERSGLIRSSRNSSSNYREYNTQQLLEICDILFYRNLNIPVKELNDIWSKTPNEQASMLTHAKENIEHEIQKLNSIQQKIDSRLSKIQEYHRILNHPYEHCDPPFSSIINLRLRNRKNLQKYIEDQGILGFVFSCDSPHIDDYGLIRTAPPEPDDHILWQQDQQTHQYAECILRVHHYTVDMAYFQQHLDYFRQHRQTCGQILCSYLLSDEIYEYYHAWVELL